MADEIPEMTPSAEERAAQWFCDYENGDVPKEAVLRVCSLAIEAAHRDGYLAAREAESTALRQAAEPILDWLDHIGATGSRRLGDNEWPPISGVPNMGQLRALRRAVVDALLPEGE